MAWTLVAPSPKGGRRDLQASTFECFLTCFLEIVVSCWCFWWWMCQCKFFAGGWSRGGFGQARSARVLQTLHVAMGRVLEHLLARHSIPIHSQDLSRPSASMLVCHGWFVNTVKLCSGISQVSTTSQSSWPEVPQFLVNNWSISAIHN